MTALEICLTEIKESGFCMTQNINILTIDIKVCILHVSLSFMPFLAARSAICALSNP
jgi:hypothetical protein